MICSCTASQIGVQFHQKNPQEWSTFYSENDSLMLLNRAKLKLKLVDCSTLSFKRIWMAKRFPNTFVNSAYCVWGGTQKKSERPNDWALSYERTSVEPAEMSTNICSWIITISFYLSLFFSSVQSTCYEFHQNTKTPFQYFILIAIFLLCHFSCGCHFLRGKPNLSGFFTFSFSYGSIFLFFFFLYIYKKNTIWTVTASHWC